MLLHPGVELKAVEGNALGANRDLGDIGAYFGVEAVSVHAQVARGVAEAQQTREEVEPRRRLLRLAGAHLELAVQRWPRARTVARTRTLVLQLAPDHPMQVVDLDADEPTDAVRAQALRGDRATQGADRQPGNHARLGERHILGTD